MRSYRIGKTLKIRWGILTGGKSEPLSGRDLRLEIATGSRFRRNVPFEADDSVAEFLFQGSEQRYVGAYTLTMWENRGKENQTVVDRCDAFCLVACSCEESAESADEPNLDVETLELGSSNLETGVPGMSAYELFKRHNPDSALTEEQYAEAPVQAAEAALVMVEQLEKTEASVTKAEHTREQAEQGREASERARATAEQARVTAEQQRTLAEQTRVTNESSRQTAETGRQAAETKREENTSEAIRNCKTATQEAEDEAARVRTLADNPPKIVEVDGVKYWAFWDEATGQYVPSENRADVGDAVLFSPQALAPQQQEQARLNIGAQTEHVFEDIRNDERSMYAYNGLIFYINSNGRISSFNERTFEVVSYDKINPPTHSYNMNINGSVKRFIVRDGKILTFSTNSDRIVLWDLGTQEKIYEATPLSANKTLWHSGKFIECNGRIFLSQNALAVDYMAEIDFDTGSVVKTIGIFKGITLYQYYSYFSYENDDLSLFVAQSRIIQYDKSTDEFSILVDTSPSVIDDENINITKGRPSCIFKCPVNDTEVLIFTDQGVCVNPLSDILLGKFNSTRNFIASVGFSRDSFNKNRPFAQFSANEFISDSMQVSLLNAHGYYYRTFGMSDNADFNRLGYFTKGELGVVFNRGINNGFRVDTLPIYRRYGNDIH